jgi:hypothetical protein
VDHPVLLKSRRFVEKIDFDGFLLLHRHSCSRDALARRIVLFYVSIGDSLASGYQAFHNGVLVSIYLERVPRGFASMPRRTIGIMLKLRICIDCGRLINEAGDAVRRHETDILSGLQSNLEGYLTEEARQLRASETVASFNEAQARWDAYREHMVGHGFLEPHAKTAKMPA